MQVDKTLISKLEKLARLKLSATESTQIQGDLNNILQMVSKLEELDLDNVEPLIYITEEVNVLREDEIKNQVDRAAALSNAPDKNEEHFKVPKVIDL
ncbi:MAG: Asp-tRNA(Asn)/Glu-tRNA(Gln) amidotransferase subunit GatC [Saprospiraceae bacterium]